MFSERSRRNEDRTLFAFGEAFPFRSLTNAVSLIRSKKRHEEQGAVCECCVYKCTNAEIRGYCS